jgi:sortase A
MKKRIIIAIPAFALCAGLAAPALAANYSFSSGADTAAEFGHATPYDDPVTPDPMRENIRRNKDAALLPPPYGVFSGDIPTEPSSPYHDNSRESGFAFSGQNPPPSGGEDYAPGINGVTTALLPSASQTAAQNTAPLYYADGSIGTLYIHKTGKTVAVYEGESADNLKKGAGHFTATSAWDGNVALCGHNRGSSEAYFSFVKDMQIGDRVTYTTLYGSRVYEVFDKEQIGEYDNSGLAPSSENLLTLITCIENTPDQRQTVSLRAVE